MPLKSDTSLSDRLQRTWSRSRSRSRKRQKLLNSLLLCHNCYPNINRERIRALKDLTRQFSFSSSSGDVILLENRWYVTHTGLLRLARRKSCRGILVEAVDSLCDSAANRFVLKATVYPSKDSAGFVGFGDTDPANVSPQVRGTEMRIVENRGVNRALPKLVKSPSLVCVCRLASTSDRGSPQTVPTLAREGIRFVDSLSDALVSQVLRGSLSSWLVFG
jgi:hypothetical protein